MIKSIAFTVYPVADMARSRKFYETIIGLEPGGNFQNTWMEYNIGDSTLAVTTTDMGHPPGAKGAIVGLETDDLDHFIKNLKVQGVKFVLDPFDTPVCRMAVIEDPDANHLVIHQRHQAET